MLIIQEGPLAGRACTPAHRYVYQGDFMKILEDIDKGEIPCGSGQPFPVEFTNPEDDISKMNSGWGSSSPSPTYNGGNVINGFTFGNIG